MSNPPDLSCADVESCNASGCTPETRAQQLNQYCYCKTLNMSALHQWINEQALPGNLLASIPQFFSNTAVFINPLQLQKIQAVVRIIDGLARQPLYQQWVAPGKPIKDQDATGGVFMGYDFHLYKDGPQLIEINTNAGGGFLNTVALGAQTACCNMGDAIPALQEYVEQTFVEMFQQEWQLVRESRQPKTLAIVDDNPTQQFLYPEFLLAQRLLQLAGIKTCIVDPTKLIYENDQLCYQGEVIDMVYNRLTDFSLQEAKHQALGAAYYNNAVVLSPNPVHHALYANKRNLAILSDASHLARLGLDENDIRVLGECIPSTQILNDQNANQLWQARKNLFFKPATGFGSRAAYRGDKLTKRVWEEILQGDYVAQQQIPPSERGILVDDTRTSLKVDIRAYAYAGKVLLLAARLYQGQTTNFRTQGGGFAPVFVAQ